MRRREFIAGLGIMAAWPIAAPAQQATTLQKVGFLYPGLSPFLGANAKLLADLTSKHALPADMLFETAA